VRPRVVAETMASDWDFAEERLLDPARFDFLGTPRPSCSLFCMDNP
jgi:hypothetical protein